jgi:hypothetical protein
MLKGSGICFFWSFFMFKVIANRRRVVLGSFLLLLSSLASAATFTVTNTSASGPGSLQQAIIDANATAGADVIQFNIAGAAPFVISGMADMPLTDAVTIDGTSQPGYSGAPLIEIRGDTDGEQIDVNVSDCIISGLSFTEQFKAVVFWAPNSTVRDCYFGLKPDGVTQTECSFGVEMESSYDVVGPNNVFVGSADRPLDIDNGAHHNSVIGNTFGLDASGNNSLVVPTGLLISGSDNTIGGDDAASRNVINYRDYGIRIFGNRNVVKGNWIGFDKPGLRTFGFPSIGIYLQSGSDNVIGTPGAPPNLVIGNDALWVDHAFNTTIQNNWIGFNTQGVVTMNRPSDGIYVRNGSSGTQIGGGSAGARNYVGNFNNNGIHIEDSTFTTIQGNTIGLDPINGAQALNHLGIRIDRSSNLLIGGSNSGEGNLISGNVAGIVFASRPSGTDQAVIKGNYIGTDATGNAARGNSDDGITISYGPTHITIGGPEPGAGNVISANGGFGIDIGFSFDSSSATNDVLVQGNRIGIAAIDGFPAMPNTAGGISNAFGVRNHYTQNSIAYTGTKGILPKIANDPGDSDAGANNGQNFPVLSPVLSDGTTAQVIGSLNSTANTTFTIEFFQNSVDQTSGGGPGEGAKYFGSTSVTTDGSGNATFDTTFPVSIALGRYVTSTATDAAGNTSCFSTYAVVRAPNQPPVANAGADQTVTIPHDGNPATNTISINLDGSASSDPENDPLTYSWSDGSSIVGTAAQITLAKQAGTYTFTLTVTDSSGASSSDSVLVTVKPEPNRGPNKPASGNFVFAVPHDGNPATNTASISATAAFLADPDGDPQTFRWTDLSGNVVSTTPTFTATFTPGIYHYNFQITDSYGSSSTLADQTITVNAEPNAAPLAKAGADQSITISHDGNPATNTASFTINGSTSSDADGDTLTYAWKEGAVSVGTTASLSFTRTPGTYTFDMTVTDSYGLSSTDSVVVIVNAEPNGAPVAQAGPDQSVTVLHDGDPATNTASFTINGSASTDPDNDTVTYEWKDGATTVGSTPSIVLSRVAGSYTFTLTVSDPYGALGTDTVNVIVNSEPNSPPSITLQTTKTLSIPHDGSAATNTANTGITASVTDPEGDSLTLTWTDASSSVVGSGNALNIPLTTGSYVFTLTAVDVYGASASKSITVTVQAEPNSPPSVTLATTKTLTVPHDGNPATNTVQSAITAVISDPENDLFTITWTNASNTVVGNAATLDIPLTPGSYTFTVRAADSYGATTTKSISVTVNPEPNRSPNKPPIITLTQTIPHDGNPATNTITVTLGTSLANADPDGDPITVRWKDLNGNVIATTPQLTVTLTPGVYHYEWDWSDPYGPFVNGDLGTVTINAEPNSSPTVSLVATKTVAIPHDGDPTTNTALTNVTATASDSNGDPLTFAWTDASNNVVSTTTTLNIPLTTGTYAFSFTATDSYGASTSKSITITVTTEPNSTPVITLVATKSQAVAHDGNPATNTADVSVTATVSDANNDPLTLAWTASDSTLVGNTATLNVTLTPGVYVYTLTAADAYTSASKAITITVTAEPNSPPSYASGGNQNVTIPHDGNPATNTINVTPTATFSDPDGDPITYSWADGNNTDLGSTVALAAGNHDLKIRATDSYGASTTVGFFTVQVAPEPNATPITTVSEDQTVQVAHDGNPATNTASVTVSGTATDPDSDPLTLQWTDENNASLGSGLSLTTSLTVGDHTLTLTATDSYGAASSHTVHVTVMPEANASPTSIVGPDHTITAAPGNTTAIVALNGSGSSDPDNDPLTYSWSDGQGVIGTTANLSVTKGFGTYTFTLRVTDPYGATSSASVTIIVKSSNQPPVAIVGPDLTATVPHDGIPNTNTAAVNLDGSASNDPDAGQGLTYQWTDQNNAPAGSAAHLSVTLTPGSYLYTLTVTDPFGATSSSTEHVTVLPEPNAAPFVNGGADMLGAANNVGQATFTLNASASDQDGDALTIKWFEGATQIGTGATLTATLPAGSHTLTVTATDPYGATASDTVVVSVQYSGDFFNQPINNDGSSIFKQGSTVPVKFTLTGASANANIVAHIYIAKVTNSIVGTEMEAVSTSQADTGNTFRSGGGSQWIFNLNTKNLTAGTYQVRADLGDGVLHTVIISLKA